MTDIRLHPRVLELLASRICHDLVSPVGAIANGMELLEELGEDGEEESIKLISNSTAEASTRLKCFRLCYGAAGSDRNIGFDEVHTVFQEWLKASRVKLDWQKPSLPSVPKGFTKTLLLILMLAEECAHGDGTIRVSGMADGQGVEIIITGKNPKFREMAEDAMTEKISIDDLDPRLVHAYLTGMFARHFECGLEYRQMSEPPVLAFVLRTQK